MGGRSASRPRRVNPVWPLTVGLALVTLGVHLGWAERFDALPSTMHMPWWALAVLFAGTEIFVIHLEGRRDAYSVSLSEIPLVLGLAFGTVHGLILGRLLGAGSALVLHRRQAAVKLVFNLALFYLETCVAVIVFRVLVAGHRPIDPRGWLAAGVAALVLHLLSAFAVTAAISLHEGRFQGRLLRRATMTGLVNTFTNTSLALVAVGLMWHDARAGALLFVVVAILFFLSRAYASLSQRYASLQSLYLFTRSIGRSLQVESVIHALLSEARELLRAETAEITLFDSGDAGGARWILEADGRMTAASPDPDLADLTARVVGGGEAVLVARSSADGPPDEKLAALGMRDAMIAPVLADRSVVGTMLVTNRLGAVTSTFDAEDLKLFETLVNHASITLENGRLVDRLRREAADKEHQALHDALTGLPNRTLFRRRIEEAIAATWGTTDNVAVMLMDLDRFKEVNDTLGHHNGDLLLQDVSARLAGLLRPVDVIARLGGDEFAILLPQIHDSGEAVAAAEKVLGALQEPFVHRELTLEVGASIGIALYPHHGAEAATLLQRADVAMYAAKAAQCGYEIYAAEHDQYSPRRLALVGELRSAIDSEQLEVYYQPQAELGSRRVAGVEALVRWNHPRHGYLPPDEFIPVAEHTGLIRPLTLHVLRTALRQCRQWQDQGTDLRLAVNLSARSLLDVHLPDDVAGLLEAHGVAGRSLVLEITESSIMADSPRTIGVMSRLSAMGVQLAIDDFGTGYSSLSYLKRLPVDEIKVDRSFVINMLASDNDAKIVRSTVNLARDLGLRVVAEGVETEEIWQRLVELGCDLAQGYLLSRPLPAAKLEEWLQDMQTPSTARVIPITAVSR